MGINLFLVNPMRKEQEVLNYERIEKAIRYIRENYHLQPSLSTIASEIGLSQFHFQKLFTEWAGVSPKEFLQNNTIVHARRLLRNEKHSLFETASESGLSGTSRLHDLFIKIEAMSPAEYRDGGRNLRINYSFGYTQFGSILIASTDKGICRLSFTKSMQDELHELHKEFPEAVFTENETELHREAILFFSPENNPSQLLNLHLKGSSFRLKVWEALLKIPTGELRTYGELGNAIGMRKSARAVGNAIGSNPVAFLIPCHRVIQSSGHLGGYMWGQERKAAIIFLEENNLNVR